jgi:DNA-binding response OmpR family regulator
VQVTPRARRRPPVALRGEAARASGRGDEHGHRREPARPSQGPHRKHQPGDHPNESTRGRILVVDDEAGMRFLCATNLNLANFDVVEASTGAEALEHARAGDFDLVLLDVMLPDMGGLEVAEKLMDDERTRAVPIVFLSARATREDLSAGYELGAADYITKPFDPVELGPRVSEILARIERGEGERYRRERLAELRE